MTGKHPFWPLSLDENNAEIFLMPCPGTKEPNLDNTITQLKEQGVKAILSVLSADEMKLLDVESMPDVCQQQDISWFNLPVGNHQLPDDAAMSDWQQYKSSITSVLDQGGKVAVHCKGGTTRTGMGAAMVLLELGWAPERAIAEVQSIKPRAFSHESNVSFIENMATDTEVHTSDSTPMNE